MRMNRLGNSDLVVSAVGAGTWAMGGDFFGAIDDKKCIDSLCASLDHGVNLIDTAPIYGKGHSETLVGQAIKGRRDKVVLCTKVGLLFDDPKGRQGKCLQPDSIEYEIEQSLRRLGTDYIDLYQIHWPDVNTPIEETMEALLRIQKAGKVRYLVYQVKIIMQAFYPLMLNTAKRSRTTVEALEIKGYRYAAVDKQVKRMKLRTLQVTTNDFLFLALSLLWISLAMLGSALF